MKTITKKDFQNYCNSLFLAVLEISENENSFFALVKTGKNNDISEHFTQVEKLNRYYKVRLSKKDINNNLITNNFFNN